MTTKTKATKVTAKNKAQEKSVRKQAKTKAK